jgi:hypothetical protein
MAKLSRPPPRPVATQYLPACRAVGILSGAAGGVALALGTWRDALASGGLNLAVCIMIAIAVPAGISVAWHKIFGLGAYAREIHERAAAGAWGVVASGVGVALSGWFLASLIGGEAALREYRVGYIEQVKAAWSIAAANASVEGEIIGVLNSAAANLNATAETEAATGLLSGHSGKSVVYSALKNAAKGAASMSTALTEQQQQRTDALTRASDALDEAARNVANGDAAEFQNNAAKAATEVAAAARIRLGASGLNIGISATDTAQIAIAATQEKIAAVVSNVNSRRRSVPALSYQPIDAKTAMLKNPQALACLAAIVVELLPLICLGLLLTMWRDEEDAPRRDDEGPGNFGPTPESNHPRPRIVSSVPAE